MTSAYLTEPVVWGGLPSTRGEMIATMRAEGVSQVEIDRYMQGFDLGCAATAAMNEYNRARVDYMRSEISWSELRQARRASEAAVRDLLDSAGA